MGVSIEAVSRRDLYNSRLARKEFGLMSNDSLLIATMRRLKLRNMITNDSDFKQVKNILILTFSVV